MIFPPPTMDFPDLLPLRALSRVIDGPDVFADLRWCGFKPPQFDIKLKESALEEEHSTRERDKETERGVEQ